MASSAIRKTPSNTARAQPARRRGPGRRRRATSGRVLPRLAAGLTVALVFALGLILDTGAVFRLWWACLGGGFGLPARLAAIAGGLVTLALALVAFGAFPTGSDPAAGRARRAARPRPPAGPQARQTARPEARPRTRRKASRGGEMQPGAEPSADPPPPAAPGGARRRKRG